MTTQKNNIQLTGSQFTVFASYRLSFGILYPRRVLYYV